MDGLSRFSAAICCCQIMISQLMFDGFDFFHREKNYLIVSQFSSNMTVDATEGLDVDEICFD